MLKKYKDALCGGFLVLLAIGLFVASFGIRSVALNLIKADFFPRLAAGLFFILGAILIGTGLRKAKSYQEEDETALPFWKNDSTISMLETLALIAAYILVMKPLGFVIATLLYLTVQMYVLTPHKDRSLKNLGLYGVIALVASFGVYLIFVKVFYLMLPAGILPF